MPTKLDFTGAEPRLARKTAKKQDWIRGDPNWVAFVALVPFKQISTVAYIPRVSGGSVVMPPPFIWGMLATAPTQVSAGASVQVPRSDAALTGYAPDVGQGLLIPIPRAGDITLAANAPTVSAGAALVVTAPPVVTLVCYAPVLYAGAQVSIPFAQIGHEGYVPQIRQDFPYRIIIPSVLAITVAAILPVVSAGAVVILPGRGEATLLAYIPDVTAASISFTYNGEYHQVTSTATFTLTGVSFGAAATGRRVVVLISAGKAGTTAAPITSVTIGGVAATISVQRSNGAANLTTVGIAVATVPTGTSGSVVVAFSGGSLNRIGIGSYSVYGMSSSTAVATNNTVTNGGAMSLANTSGGVAFAVGYSRANTSATWGNIAENYDVVWDTSRTHSGASVSTTGSTLSITCTFGTSSEYAAVCASYF